MRVLRKLLGWLLLSTFLHLVGGGLLAFFPLPIPHGPPPLSYPLTIKIIAREGDGAQNQPFPHPDAPVKQQQQQPKSLKASPTGNTRVKTVGPDTNETKAEMAPSSPTADKGPSATTLRADAAAFTGLMPDYPYGAIRRQEEGVVYCRVEKNQGSLAVTILRSSGFARLDQAAVQAVEDYNFKELPDGALILAFDFRLDRRQ